MLTSVGASQIWRHVRTRRSLCETTESGTEVPVHQEKLNDERQLTGAVDTLSASMGPRWPRMLHLVTLGQTLGSRSAAPLSV
jgi:hypothetical protein